MLSSNASGLDERNASRKPQDNPDEGLNADNEIVNLEDGDGKCEDNWVEKGHYETEKTTVQDVFIRKGCKYHHTIKSEWYIENEERQSIGTEPNNGKMSICVLKSLVENITVLIAPESKKGPMCYVFEQLGFWTNTKTFLLTGLLFAWDVKKRNELKVN